MRDRLVSDDSLVGSKIWKGLIEESNRGHLNRSYVFGAALLAEFIQEVVLLHRRSTAQELEQGIFHFLAGFLRLLVSMFKSMFKLTKIGNQSTRRNIQLQHSLGAVAQKANQIAHVGPLFSGAGRELDSPAVARMCDSYHALGVHFP